MNPREGITLNPLSRRAPSTGLGDASSVAPEGTRRRPRVSGQVPRRQSGGCSAWLPLRCPCNLAEPTGVVTSRQPRRSCRRLSTEDRWTVRHAATSSIRERSHVAEYSRSRTEVRAQSKPVPATAAPGPLHLPGARSDPAQHLDPRARVRPRRPEEARRVRHDDRLRPALVAAYIGLTNVIRCSRWRCLPGTC